MKGELESVTSEDKYDVLKEISEQAVIELDNSGSFMSVNQGFVELFGANPTDSSYRMDYWFHPEDLPSLDKPEVKEFKRCRIRHHDGDYIECEYRLREYKFTEPRQYLLVIKSIRTKHLITAGESALESLFTASAGFSDQIFVEKALHICVELSDSQFSIYARLDPLNNGLSQIVVYPANNSYIKKNGINPEKLINNTLNSIMEESRQNHLPLLITKETRQPETISTEIPGVDNILSVVIWEKEHPVAIILIAGRITPYRTGESDFIQFYGKLLSRLQSRRLLLSELTEKSRTLETVTRENARLTKITGNPNQSLSHFLGNLSHHIRNPMNGIMGFAELLNEDNISADDRHTYINIIHENGRMLLDLFDTLFELSRVEAGLVFQNKVTQSISLLVEQVSLRYREGFIGNRNILIKIANEIPSDLDQVNIDGSLVKKVLIAIINYVHYSCGIESIELCSRSEPKGPVYFEVIWHPDEKEIFNENTTDENAELKLASGIVRILSGTLKMENLGSRGEMISVTIPCQRANTKSSDEESFLAENFKGYWRNRRILIIEDDDVSFQFLNAVLRSTGITIFRADSGIKGVQFVKDNPDLDLVLLDIRLPEMDGIEAAGKIKAIKKGILLIAQTAYAFPEDRERCLSAGCVDVLTKPIRREQLFQIMKKWLN